MTTLITGGAGKTGGRVANLLSARGQSIRPVSRSTEPRFDWNDPSSWPAVLDGCDAAYVSFQPDIGLPGSNQTIGAFAEAAVAAGCRRLVLISGRGEEGARRAEQALIDSGADWTILRAAFFMQNFTESLFAPEIAAGRLTMLRHRVGEPFIDAADIAEVAVAALDSREHIGQVYELTGPELLTFGDVAYRIGAAGGQPIDYTELDLDEFIEHLVGVGVPQEDATGLTYVFDEVLDGRNARVTTGVADVLHRSPRDLSSFLAGALEPVSPER